MMKKVISIVFAVLLAIIIILLATYIIMGYDNEIKIAQETVESYKVKSEVKIVALSDLHCTRYGEKQSILLGKIEKCHPDLVLLLGDFFDAEDDPSPSVEFLEQISGKYQIYAVKGNHEIKTKDHVNNFIDELYEECDIPLLTNKCYVIDVNGNRLNICGVDSRYYGDNAFPDDVARTMIGVDTSYFTILLNHRPDTYNVCINHNIDLMLSGHTHGGQWVLPGVFDALYAPNQGLFAEYAGGKYIMSDGMTLIVSRGLAINSVIPRVFNPPEINLITLKPNN